MGKEENFVIEGEVTEVLPNTLFRVEIKVVEDVHADLKGTVILCHLSGKMRRYFIKVMPGDSVQVVMTTYDLGKGRITFRNK